jgi:aquaporin Z
MSSSMPARELRPLNLQEPKGLQTPWTRDFEDLSFEWRRLFSEVFGTFLLVLVAAGATVVNARSHGAVPLDAQVVVPGLMVIAIIYFMGTVSGAHLNPTVTISFALRGNFPWMRVPGYVLAQLAGSVLAAAFLRGTLGNVGHLGATAPGSGISATAATLFEIVLTAGLVSVILGTASGARNIGANAALAVGAYIALAGLWAAPVSGASMNPARSLGPALVGGHWRDWWVYLIGPMAGGLVAVVFAWVLRGAPTASANEAAQGSPPAPSGRR